MLRLDNSVKRKISPKPDESDAGNGVLYVGIQTDFTTYDLGMLTATLSNTLEEHLKSVSKPGSILRVDAVPFRRHGELFECKKEPKYIPLVGERAFELIHTAGYLITMKTPKGLALAVLVENEIERLFIKLGEEVPRKERLYGVYYEMMLRE